MQGKEKAEEREIAVGMGQSKGATQIILMTIILIWGEKSSNSPGILISHYRNWAKHWLWGPSWLSQSSTFPLLMVQTWH